MKIINLPRGSGKTTRLLYASEFNNTPILCVSQHHKQHLLDRAKELNLTIPEPITPSDVINGGTFKTNLRETDLFIDDAQAVLRHLLMGLGMMGNIKAIAITDEES